VPLRRSGNDAAESPAPSSRLHHLRLYQLHDQADRVEVLRIRLVRLHRDAVMLFEKHYELHRCQRIEDAAGDEWRRVRELARVFSGKELVQYEFLHGGADIRHTMTSTGCRDRSDWCATAPLPQKSRPCCSAARRGAGTR